MEQKKVYESEQMTEKHWTIVSEATFTLGFIFGALLVYIIMK